MKKLLLVAVLLMATAGLAALTPAEKAELKTTLTVVENQTIEVRFGDAFQQKYFINCIFTGTGTNTFWHTCVFEDCTFNLSFERAKFLWSYLEGGTFTQFSFKNSAVFGSNVPDNKLDVKCKKGKVAPTKKDFTDHVAKVKEKKNK